MKLFEAKSGRERQMMSCPSQVPRDPPLTLSLIPSALAVRLPDRRHPQLKVAPRHQRLQCSKQHKYKSKLCVATFFWLLQLPALRDLDLFGRLVSHALGHIFDLLDDVVSFEDFPKHNVLAVQPAGDGGCDEELVSLSASAKPSPYPGRT